jgi:hypothetical protein
MDSVHSHNPKVLNKSTALRWQSLSSALESLTAASKLPNAENLPKIHIARGDAEMYRWRLGRAPWDYMTSRENASTLLKNAQTYYRGATALARRDGAVNEGTEAAVKEALVSALAGEKTKIEQLLANTRKDLMHVAEDMVEDGLVDTADLDGLLSS